MIMHVVLFRPRPGLLPEAREELANALSGALREIKSVRRAHVGRRRTHGRAYEQLMREDYTHAVILEFDDLQGLKSYLEDPAHETLGTQFFACFEQALMYDFEMNEGEAGIQILLNDERA